MVYRTEFWVVDKKVELSMSYRVIREIDNTELIE